jgi:hypothetical protein
MPTAPPIPWPPSAALLLSPASYLGGPESHRISRWCCPSPSPTPSGHPTLAQFAPPRHANRFTEERSKIHRNISNASLAVFPLTRREIEPAISRPRPSRSSVHPLCERNIQIANDSTEWERNQCWCRAFSTSCSIWDKPGKTSDVRLRTDKLRHSAHEFRESQCARINQGGAHSDASVPLGIGLHSCRP